MWPSLFFFHPILHPLIANRYMLAVSIMNRNAPPASMTAAVMAVFTTISFRDGNVSPNPLIHFPITVLPSPFFFPCPEPIDRCQGNPKSPLLDHYPDKDNDRCSRNTEGAESIEAAYCVHSDNQERCCRIPCQGDAGTHLLYILHSRYTGPNPRDCRP